MNKKITSILLAAVIITASSCNSSNKVATVPNERGERPTAEAIIIQMDANKDGKLSKAEVKGPLLNDFAKIDTDADGFISKAELEKAPKPSGDRPKQGPPQNNRN